MAKQKSKVRISNIEIDGDNMFARGIDDIAVDIRAVCASQPYLAQNQLIAVGAESAPIQSRNVLRPLMDPNKLFAWLHDRAEVHWSTAVKKITSKQSGESISLIGRSEIYEHLCATTQPNYSSIELIPHYPAIESSFYVPCNLPEADGSAIKEFMEHVNADSEEDRALTLAALLTPAWGGPPGSKPLFVFASDHGRGSGKTETAELICAIYGGRISANAEKENWVQFKTRLLSDESIGIRCVLIDNVKTKLHGGQIESMLTTPTIDGHKMYKGQQGRANLFTYFVTSNSPNFSKDMSDRSIIVKFGAPKQGCDWKSWSLNFVKNRRAALLADIFAMLRRPPVSVVTEKNRDRWGMWQDAVLTKIAGGDDLAAIIKDRREDVDADQDDAHRVAEAIEREVRESGLELAERAVRISTDRLYKLLRERDIIDPKITRNGVATWISDFLGSQGPLRHLFRKRTNESRFWVYVPFGCDMNIGLVDLPEYTRIYPNHDR